MTYSQEDKQRLMKAVGLWLAGYVVVAGFLYYHSAIPLGPVLIAGAATLALTIFKARKP